MVTTCQVTEPYYNILILEPVLELKDPKEAIEEAQGEQQKAKRRYHRRRPKKKPAASQAAPGPVAAQ